jgi:Ca-activated chloride channel homolog
LTVGGFGIRQIELQWLSGENFSWRVCKSCKQYIPIQSFEPKKRFTMNTSLLTLISLSWLFLFSFTGTHPTPSQTDTGTGTLSGIVTDAASGKPVEGVRVVLQGSSLTTTTGPDGRYHFAKMAAGNYDIMFEHSHYAIAIRKGVFVAEHANVVLSLALQPFQAPQKFVQDNISHDIPASPALEVHGGTSRANMEMIRGNSSQHIYSTDDYNSESGFNTEEYDFYQDNRFREAMKSPLSTFSIDVDAASYANVRRFLTLGTQPPKDAVRIEEMVNYFSYDYPTPGKDVPFSVYTEVADCPWNPENKLIHIGIQGRMLDYEEVTRSNLVFLIDVSGSMRPANKIPLVKKSMGKLVDNLQEDDLVSIVVYAGAAGLVLPPTPAGQKEAIMAALDRLEAGGSTAGGAGIQLAYKVAQDNFIKDGNNRVILATDGDFNVGASSTGDLVRMVEQYRNSGIYLTLLGFGMGNYKDNRMKQLSANGNGNYFYIDREEEADKVFGRELLATLFTIAKDVKIQVEFNPDKVVSYRLIGYEHRMLKTEDFRDDQKDAGELGPGHTVTALYEIVPAPGYGGSAGIDKQNGQMQDGSRDDLKYQQTIVSDQARNSTEMMTVKLRYKHPKTDKASEVAHTIHTSTRKVDESTDDFRWSAAVAMLGMLLRDSEHKGNSTYSTAVRLAESAKGKDEDGLRQELVDMMYTFIRATASRN